MEKIKKVTWSCKVEQPFKDKLQKLVAENNINSVDIVIAGYEKMTCVSEDTNDSKIIKITDKDLADRVEELVGQDGYFYEKDLIEAGVETLQHNEFMFKFDNEDLIKKVKELESIFSPEEIIEIAHAAHNNKIVSEEDYDYLNKCKELKLDPIAIKNEKEKTYEKHIEKVKKYFQEANFDLKNFEEFPLNLSIPEDRYKVASLSFWVPFQTFMITAKNKRLYVTDVDYQFDRISFGEVGKEQGVVIPMKKIFENLSTVKLYKLKDLDSLES
jgi:hypothetical protein